MSCTHSLHSLGCKADVTHQPLRVNSYQAALSSAEMKTFFAMTPEMRENDMVEMEEITSCSLPRAEMRLARIGHSL